MHLHDYSCTCSCGRVQRLQLRGCCWACNWPAPSTGAPSDRTKNSSCGRARRHAVAVGCDTCSCMPSVEHATGPPPVSQPLRQNKGPVATMLVDMQLQSDAALVAMGMLPGLQQARPSTSALFDRTKTSNCSRARRHGVAVGCDTCSCIPSVGLATDPTGLYSNYKQS